MNNLLKFLLILLFIASFVLIFVRFTISKDKSDKELPIIISGNLEINISELNYNELKKQKTKISYLKLYYYCIYIKKDVKESEVWLSRYINH